MTNTENMAHKAAMQALQAEQRAKVQEKEEAGRGLLYVHTGDGKGKSTAAFGTVIRALGWGHRVAIVQYVKGAWKTGEKLFFGRFPDLLEMHTMGDGFTWDTQDRSKDIASAEAAWAKSRALMESGEYDLVMLDELNIVLRNDYLSLDEVLEGLSARHTRTSVIVTGRNAPDALVALADLVTDMTPVKHPFEAGIKAKKGLDF
ncbi:MAG: cob(I)yrinic acid a,c-diamide adenosyltransferase [Alphaproteobacteria bacterium]|nr:cob(I)yrinic acid a,c-diamide adenosyltransferase [Alphaproteobacteria bacterium]